MAPCSLTRQRGAAMLLMMFIIGLAVTAYVVQSYDTARLKAEREERTSRVLAEAKTALMAWSVTHPEFPGVMPYPDRGNEGYDDGGSDCFSSNRNFNRAFLIGMLPIVDSRDTNCKASLRKGVSTKLQLASADMRGKYGGRLWYAVSRNLVHNYAFAPSDLDADAYPNAAPIINAGMLLAADFHDPPYWRRKSELDNVIGTTPYPWLKVIDGNGQLISNRVAAVIMAAGLPVAGQSRSANAPDTVAYLDSMQINGVMHSNADYQVDDEDFIQAPATTTFNDRLVYITIDELMAAVETRVAREAARRDFSAEMVRCTLQGCQSRFRAMLRWQGAGNAVVTPAGDPDVSRYSDMSTARAFDCVWRIHHVLKCETIAPDTSGYHLDLQTPMVVYPFNTRKFTLVDGSLIRVYDQAGDEQGTIRPAPGSLMTVANEQTMVRPSTWPAWYFTQKWHEYGYAVAEEFDAVTGAAHCAADCLVLHLANGAQVTAIRQLVFVRGLSRLGIFNLPDGMSASNQFPDISASEGASAWKQ